MTATAHVLLDDDDFAAVRDYLAGAAGLVFDEGRRAGLALTLGERMRESGADDVADYLAGLRSGAGDDERQRLIDGVTVRETRFFRNQPQVDALRSRILPELLRRAAGRDRPLTIWSAGCSTGEEPYTLAMLLLELAPVAATGSEPWARIVATDVSAAALRCARRATYAGRTLANVPATVRDRWFEPRPGGALAVRDEVRRIVEVAPHNLVTQPAPFAAREVDLVVCRNVTIYFSGATTRLLVGAFHDVLAEGGYLLLGHAETLWRVSDAFTLVPVGDAFAYRRTQDVRAEAMAAAASTAASTSIAASRSTAVSRSTAAATSTAASRSTAASTSPARPARRRSRTAGLARRTAGSPDDASGLPGPAPATTAVGLLAAARAALGAGDYRDAARLAEAATVADVLLAEGYVVLGHARSTLGLDAQALEPLRKAVYLEPGAGHAHFLLAGALARVGQHGPAAVSYRAAAYALGSTSPRLLTAFLAGRAVGDLVDLCERLSRVSAEVAADDAVLAAGRVAP